MNWLFEDPTLIIVAGILIEAMLAGILVKSGRLFMLLPMAGVLALVLLGMFVEAMVVTDSEQVDVTLGQISQALESNDVKRLLAFIDPAAKRSRTDATQGLSLVRVEKAQVSSAKITVQSTAKPPTAQADVIGKFTIKGRREALPRENFPLRFVVQFRKTGDQWLVTDYEQKDLRGEHTH
jgi:hypothetical protein